MIVQNLILKNATFNEFQKDLTDCAISPEVEAFRVAMGFKGDQSGHKKFLEICGSLFDNCAEARCNNLEEFLKSLEQMRRNLLGIRETYSNNKFQYDNLKSQDVVYQEKLYKHPVGGLLGCIPKFIQYKGEKYATVIFEPVYETYEDDDLVGDGVYDTNSNLCSNKLVTFYAPGNESDAQAWEELYDNLKFNLYLWLEAGDTQTGYRYYPPSERNSSSAWKNPTSKLLSEYFWLIDNHYMDFQLYYLERRYLQKLIRAAFPHYDRYFTDLSFMLTSRGRTFFSCKEEHQVFMQLYDYLVENY